MIEKPLSRFVQPISVPGRRLLHHIPLRFVQRKVGGGGQRAVNAEIPLIPFIDFLLCIVLFLLASFSATGELPIDKSIKLPNAENVRSGAYPISRNLYFYSRKAPEGPMKDFVDFALSDPGQKLVTEVGYFPVR